MSDSRVQSYLVLGLMGAGDLVAGLACAAIGLSKDIQVMAIVGTVLVISGAGMLAYLVWSKSRPEPLWGDSYVIYGAGAVGGVIGARLDLAGHDVTLVARGEHLARIRADGLRLDTADGVREVRCAATDTAADVDWSAGPVVILTVKSHQTEAALVDLARFAPVATPVVCAQNGVANEVATLRLFPGTYAITVMLPSQHLEPGLVVQACHPVPGILDIGRFPDGTDSLSERVAGDLRSAGFESVPRPDIMAWKYRKLATNAVGDVSAVLPDEADELRPLVRAEAEAVLAAAGVPLVTHEADLARRGDLLHHRPDVEGPNSLGQSLARGTPGTEVDFRAGEVVLLGRLHGVATPHNERIQRAVHQLGSHSKFYLSSN